MHSLSLNYTLSPVVAFNFNMSLGTYYGEEKLCFGLDLGTTMSERSPLGQFGS